VKGRCGRFHKAVSGLPRGLALLAAAAWVVLSLAGCSPAFSNVIDEHLIGPYELVAVDDEEQLCVGYRNDAGGGTNRIDAVVIDVGWNESYIVAARRPVGQPGGELSYYYLDIAKDTPISAYDAVTGPLTEAEFEAAKTALDLPEFTLHYPELR
jgi:hypothetical protein